MCNRNICFNFSFSILLNLLFFTKQGIPPLDVKLQHLKSDLDRLNEMKKSIEYLNDIKKSELEEVSLAVSTERAIIQSHQLELMAKRDEVTDLQRKIIKLEDDLRNKIFKQKEINKEIQSIRNDLRSFDRDITKVSNEYRFYDGLKKWSK
ncbi:hypothetical protein EDEG_00041 [Edhazardia aedis USNM 41457]|uniref:Uncharacterized protein n=1 Tax=Edhazardia aedis (strain USNM 41457) TaxID=1003232 RepID=J9DJ91_EDHAE|nr:hypothetical protein EDEG_00041 [Edhazardia aedis USNM 41457]|eukprot:EJW01447.1 hypothetical protein EDEG_00041 [Edhazardia aedis USNM 41457]